MALPADEVYRAGLELDMDERAVVAHSLLASLHPDGAAQADLDETLEGGAPSPHPRDRGRRHRARVRRGVAGARPEAARRPPLVTLDYSEHPDATAELLGTVRYYETQPGRKNLLRSTA